MIPDDFTYFAPSSLPEVWDLLRQHEGEAKILAGGQSLIPLMKFRLAFVPFYLVLAGLIVWSVGTRLGTEIFPTVDTGQFQIRFRAVAELTAVASPPSPDSAVAL